MLPIRPGLTVPLPGPLHSHRDRLRELADLGYTDVWSAESDAGDGLTPLALAAAWEPRLRLGTAILPAYTRAPALLAQSAAAMADAAPGRFALGIGSSSNVIVERWNGVPFVDPYKKVRDIVRFLRDAFSGDKVSRQYDTFRIDGFRLGVRPEQTPPILVAGLRQGMLKLAGREADGAIINWLAASDVPQVAGVVGEAAGGDEREIVARIFVCPSENTDVDPGRGGRRPGGARLTSGVPGADRRVLRQRGDHELAGDPAARPRARPLAGSRGAGAERRLTRRSGGVRPGGLAFSQPQADLGDVAHPAAAGGFVDAALHRHLDGRQQAQLLRGVRVAHAPDHDEGV